MKTPSDKIAVLGAGQMGNGIAHVFAQAGFGVTMVDISRDALAKGRDTISKNLDLDTSAAPLSNICVSWAAMLAVAVLPPAVHNVCHERSIMTGGIRLQSPVLRILPRE